MSHLYKHVPGTPPTPREYPAFDGEVELVCTACGKKRSYRVGRIFVNPSWAKHLEEPIEKWISFSGYFHCAACGSGGPWEFTDASRALLLGLMLLKVEQSREGLIEFGEMRLFDGTPMKTAVEAEAHLNKLIDATPADYFLWSRLGNLYNIAEEEERAFAAFLKAVELNPHDIESHHSLACYYLDRNQPERAAEHFHQVLRQCRDAPPRTKEKPELLRSMVRHTLERLADLSAQSDGKIKFLPSPEPTSHRPDDEPLVLVIREFDLSREQAWDDLTDMFLNPLPPSAPALKRSRPATPRQGYAFDSDPESRVGRNDPCPCGSGKKFKKCCGRA